MRERRSTALVELLDARSRCETRDEAFSDPDYLAAAWNVVELNMPLVWKVMRRTRKYAEWRDDYESFLKLTLFEVCWNYDPKGGATFAHYAITSMHLKSLTFFQQLNAQNLAFTMPPALSESAIDRRMEKLLEKDREMFDAYETERISHGEFFHYLNNTKKIISAITRASDVHRMRRVTHIVASVGEPGEQVKVALDPLNGYSDPGVSPFDDPVADEASITIRDLLVKADIARLLTDREQIVIEARFGIGRDEPATLAEIGGELNLSTERIRQIERKTIEKLRNAYAGRHIEDFVTR